MSTICIALDAMGGDHGPRVTVPAALRSLAEDPNLKLILVGLTEVLQAEISKLQGHMPANLSFVSASQVVDMDEAPTSALRNKRDSSMRVALNLVKEGVAQACVSAGNTGALMATARFVLKMLPGIDRPAIISKLPTSTGTVCILDLGANVDCTAEHLFQFAIMGSVMAEAVENISRPKVGLLNIGIESIKGNEVIKQAYLLLNQAKHLNFVGFIEGDDIYKGNLDVVVCDGFVGNVALKTSEGLANMIFKYIRQEFTQNIFRKLVGFIARPILTALKQRFDPSQYNGASFLGLRGIVVKSHGNANIDAFCNAIKMTKLEVKKNVPITIYQRVTDYLQGESK